MATEGPRSPAAGANVGSGNNWGNLTNAGASDNAYSSVANDGASKLLALTTYGFSVMSDSATINGIEVGVEASQNSAGSSTLDEVFLTKDGTTAAGNDGLSGTQALGTSDAVYTYGGASDLWGTTWTPVEVKATTFGALIRATRVTGSPRIDHVTITVHYTEPGGGGGIIRVTLDGGMQNLTGGLRG